MDVRRAVAGLGRTLIAVGTLILLFVAYQLWGTGLQEARAQRDLKDQFEALQRRASPAPAPAAKPARPGTAPAATPTTAVGPPPAPTGAAVAIVKIPRIDVEKAVVEGVRLSDLKKGPGHYPTTPMPGQPGNSAIAGHRTTYGAPFFRLDELRQGDPIFVTTAQGQFRYEVTESRVVRPSETAVLDPTGDNRLTLTTCEPRYSAARRLIVVAALKGTAAPAAPPPAVAQDPNPEPEPAPDDADQGAPGQETPSLEEIESGAGLSGQRAARGPAFAWGLLAALVGLATWLAARRWRRWPAYLVGTPVFLVVLFVFFENFSRLLPANF